MLDLANLLEVRLTMGRSILRALKLMVFLAFPAMIGFAQAAHAEEWVVLKSSGQVWIATSQAKPVALTGDATLLPGDLIQTGPTGRALLTRGQERILVAPNSVISLPKDAPKSGFTTILQQAGSIAVEAEKRDLQHFEVQTPYLAAVVKGTSFVVTVGNGVADVHVTSGQVQTINLASGQSNLVLPGQSARVTAQSGDVVVGGRGAIVPTEHGAPRPTTLKPISVPRGGLTTPPRIHGMRVHTAAVRGAGIPSGVVRITSPIGAVKLDVGKATMGLARGDGPSARGAGASPRSETTVTVWSASPTGSAGAPTAVGSVGTVAGVVGPASTNGNAGGNGLALGLNAGAGNGNGLALGLGNGNGNGNGLGPGNGNGNNGNHFAFGKFK